MRHADDRVRLPVVSVEGVPRGLVTMVVTIPADLAGAPDVQYEVRLMRDVEILGRLRGAARSAGGPARPLVLTLRVPAGADAGTVDVAEVVFRDGAGREFVVPLQLRVAVVRNVSLLGAREHRGLRSGDRLELAYRIVNAGNAPDTVRIALQAPPGWVARLDRDATAVIPARGQLPFSVTLGIPAVANIGDHTLAVTLRASASPEALATAYTTLGITGRAGEAAGLVLRPTIAFASTSTGGAAFSGVELNGPITGEIAVRAQLTPAIQRGGMTAQGLSSVGALSAPFSATVSAEHWDVSAGNTSVSLADLGGVNVVGRGLTGRYLDGRRELRAIVAAPSSGTRDVGGELIGAGWWQQTSRGRFGGSLAHLREQGGYGSGRELRAAAVDWRSPKVGTLTLQAALAHRDAPTVNGTGYAVGVDHERPGERVSARLAHAPGGTSGYARAEDEWQVEVSRTLTARWWVDASAQRAVDRGSVFAGMDSRTWTLGQRFALTPELQLSLRGGGNDFTVSASDSTIGDFGARERAVQGGAEWRRGLLAVSAEGSYGDVSRITETFTGLRVNSVAGQRGMRVSASQGTDRHGALDLHLSLEQTGAGVGLPGEIRSGGLRWSEFPITAGTRQAYLSTEATLQKLGALRTMVVTRTVLRAALPGGLDLAVSAERNPFFRDARGRAGWIAALRLSAATRVFSPGALGPEGTVFEDRDGDGRFDPLEPGVAGVVVRRGDARAVTDRHGKYRLPLVARGRTRLDPASIRAGLVMHPALAQDNAEREDIPLLPTGSVVVELVLTPDEQGRVPAVDIEPAIVILRDSSGFEWVGRRASPTLAVFEGVPIGTYTLHFDFSRLREPLRADEGLSVRVVPHVSSTLPVAVRARAIRVFTPPRRGP